MAGNPWSGAELSTLRAMWTAGDSVQAIARSLGRTEKAVEEKRRREALPARDPGPLWDEESDSELRRLWAAGMTIARIAARLDRAPCTIHLRRFALKLPPRRVLKNTQGWSAEDDATISRLWVAGCSVANISEQMGRSPGGVCSRRMHLKLPPRKMKHGSRRRHLVI